MPDALVLVGLTGVPLLVSFCLTFQLFLAVESSSMLHLCIRSRRCCTRELEILHADWTNVLCIPRQNEGRGLWPRKFDLSSHPLPRPQKYLFCWPFQGGASAVVFYFCHCVSLHVCPGGIFILDSRLANLWERNCPFDFLLVVSWLLCRCFKCVLLSFWCLGRNVLGYCIDSW